MKEDKILNVRIARMFECLLADPVDTIDPINSDDRRGRRPRDGWSGSPSEGMRRIRRGLPEEELPAIRTKLHCPDAELSFKLQRPLQPIQNVLDYIQPSTPKHLND